MYNFDLSGFTDLGEGTNERCGVLIATKVELGMSFFEVREMPNRSDDPRHGFRISWKDIDDRKVARSSVVGFIHTHPKGSPDHPSYNDINNVLPTYINVVYHLTTHNVTVYDHDGPIAVFHIDNDNRTRRVS
jgi:proteasome lid subunit RPN8/RPN11